MDLHQRENSPRQFVVNGGARRNSRQSNDATLKFLSQEEQECIQFFEETIDSLEESMEEEVSHPTDRVDGRTTSHPALDLSSGHVSYVHDPPAIPKDQDIIDLVHQTPDLIQTKAAPFNPNMPDFPSLLVRPDSHIENKPRRDLTDALPSEYNPPLPTGGFGSSDGSLYHHPGCIPTPVLIAQKIAENQGGATGHLQASSLLRRMSLDSDRPSSYSIDHPVKHGPPTSTKPTRFPGNINVMLGNKDHHNVGNVNIQERRAQMLANLTGASLHVEPAEVELGSAQKARSIPTRSVSFRDPTPDKSRMEALSKLGLTRNRALSGDMSVAVVPSPSTLAGTDTSATPARAPTPSPTGTLADRTAHLPAAGPASGRRDQAVQADPPPQVIATPLTYHPPPSEVKPANLPPPEVASLDFNNYGGKTITVNPCAPSRVESLPPTNSQENQPLPLAQAALPDFNNYGGKTKVLTPPPMTQIDLPDILSSHINRSRMMPSPASPPAKPKTLPFEINSYGGKTRTIEPASSTGPPPHNSAKTHKAPAPTPAPKPPSPHRVTLPPLSPDARRRSIPKPVSFRPQGITVQFSGRGQTEESRKEALRKLGLVKHTH